MATFPCTKCCKFPFHSLFIQFIIFNFNSKIYIKIQKHQHNILKYPSKQFLWFFLSQFTKKVLQKNIIKGLLELSTYLHFLVKTVCFHNNLISKNLNILGVDFWTSPETNGTVDFMISPKEYTGVVRHLQRQNIPFKVLKIDLLLRLQQRHQNNRQAYEALCQRLGDSQ